MTTALVIGGTGFIGSHLIKKLRSGGVRVRVLVRPNSRRAHRLRGADVEIVEGDLTDASSIEQATNGVGTVFQAGGAKGNDWTETVRTNTQGTENVVAACLAHGVERYVLVSDIEVYDLASAPKGSVVAEDWPLQSNREQMGAYVYSRIAAERRAFEAHRERGLNASVVRPGMVIGPLGEVFFPQLGYRWGDRLFLLVAGGRNVIPLTYVDDVVDGIILASIRERSIGEAYNLVDAVEITARDYVDQLVEDAGIEARVVSLPYFVPLVAITAYEGAARLRLVRGGATSRERFRWKFAAVRFDSSKAREQLGWEPRVSLFEGLARTLRWQSGRSDGADAGLPDAWRERP